MILSSNYRMVLFTLISFSILFLSLNRLQDAQYARKSDEGYYYKYASLVLQQGLPAFTNLSSWYASRGEARKHPAPVRVGYILLSAFLFKIFGPSFSCLGLISTISFFIFLLVCFYYLRKYFDLDTALIAVLFLATSPLMMGLSRRALVDSSVNLLWGTAVWLFLDILLKPNRFSYAFFLITLVIAITFKETSVILIPFFVMAGIWGRTKGFSITWLKIGGIAVFPLTVIFLLYLVIYGGWDALKAVVMGIATTHFSSGDHNFYAISYSSGPWFRYLLDFLLINPLVTLLFIGYVGYLLIHRRAFDFIKMYFLLYFVFVYSLLGSLPHSKVVRFVVNLEMVMVLFAVLMLRDLFKELEGITKQRWLLYTAVAIYLFNWINFVDIFYKPSLLDPISYNLLWLRNFIPEFV